MNDSILNYLPQRPPFLFVDKIIECDEKRIHAQKFMTGEEDFFKGHFPNNPIMPGVLLQEALFQSAIVLLNKQAKGPLGIGVVTRVDKVKFKRLVKPLDTLDLKVEWLDQIDNAYYFKGRAYVDEELTVSLEFTCALLPNKEK